MQGNAFKLVAAWRAHADKFAMKIFRRDPSERHG
jgi:hypothetical protein